MPVAFQLLGVKLMFWILPKGTYYPRDVEANRVHADSTQVAERPSEDHVLTDNWETEPMTSVKTWRRKTTAELNTEDDIAFEARIEANPLFKALFEELDILSPGLRTRIKAKLRRT